MSPGEQDGDVFAEHVIPYADDLIRLELMASLPYAQFVYGSIQEAERVDRMLLESGTAEFGPPFARILLAAGRPAGMIAVLSFAELVRARLGAAMTLRRAGVITPGSEREVAVRSAAATLWSVEPDDLYLSRLAVAPEARGRKLGSVLLAEVERSARQRACRRIVLEVASGNRPAVKLYESAGFVPGEIRAAEHEGRPRLEYLHMAKAIEVA